MHNKLFKSVFIAVMALYSLFRPAIAHEGINHGKATCLHPSLEGGVMRNGWELYDPAAETMVAVADIHGSPVVPLGSWIWACAVENDRCIWAQVKDTGRFAPHNLDFAEAAYRQFQFRDDTSIVWETIGGYNDGT